MKIAVIGAGAIGCVTGALLWEKGFDVVLVGREDQVEAVNSRGLVIDGALGERVYRIPARKTLDFKPDMTVLAVKTQDVEAACREIRPLAADSVIVTMQNGVRSDELAAAVLGGEKIISSVVMFGATYLDPGRVTYNFPGGLVIGKAFDAGNGDDGAVVEKARGALSRAFDLHVSEDIHGTHWTKLILNLNNALACILGESLQETFSDPRMSRLGVMLMKEAHEVMQAAGIRLMPLPDLPAEKLKGLLDAPLEVSSGIYGGIMQGLSKDYLPGSVLQSVKRGRATEVDYLNGEIAVLGLVHRRPAPLNMKAVGLVREVERSGGFMTKEGLLKEMDA